jgi:sugar/nucleoside kinase (ribokinase family)
MASPTYDVFAVGGYSIDLVFTGLTALPALGSEVVAKGFSMLPGEAYNSVVGMHRLGLKVGWACDFGNDEFSQFTLERLRLEGLDVSLFVHHPHPLRRISVAASLPDERAFLTYYDPDPTVTAALRHLPAVSARLVYIPGFTTGAILETGLAVARLKKMKVAMDGNAGEAAFRLGERSVRRAIERVDLFSPNAREAKMLTGERDISQAARRLGEFCPLVVVKDGANGAWACAQGELLHSSALPLTPFETTGAGDLFNAGFIKAWLDGSPVRDCLRWGNVVGGLSTLDAGGTGRVVRCEDVRQYL